MYIITIIRSDLRFALLVLFRYYSNSNLTHIKAIMRVLRYIKETLHYNIYYESNNDFIEYIDANFVETIDNCCSTKEEIYFLFSNSIL